MIGTSSDIIDSSSLRLGTIHHVMQAQLRGQLEACFGVWPKKFSANGRREVADVHYFLQIGLVAWAN
jgi:hypothetical protein